MACMSTRLLPHNKSVQYFHDVRLSPPRYVYRPQLVFQQINYQVLKLNGYSFSSQRRNLNIVAKASPGGGAIVPASDEDGVSLGTMKLPLNTDIQRFETLLFQWANSLCQGATLPLPAPLKVDKVAGGARLGFITIVDNGETDVPVYIDCLVFPPTDTTSGPIFRAIRNGRLKDKPPPGEPRIMRSLLGALQKSVEIAKL